MQRILRTLTRLLTGKTPPSDAGFQRVTISAGRKVDVLERIDLRAGEVVFVRWPTGRVTEHRVGIDRRGDERKSYVELLHEGAVARVWLAHANVSVARRR